MNSKIESLGIYLPEKTLTTSELINRCRKKPRWDLEKLTGIKERRVAENETSFDLALKACRNALKMSRHKPGDIDMIIVASISRTYTGADEYLMEPSLSLMLKNKIGANNAITFDVVNACAGMMTGIYIMDSYIRSGAIKCGMVVSGEYITHLADNAVREIRNSFDGQLASLTVGDCGAAVILDAGAGKTYGFHHINIMTGTKYSRLCVAHPSRRGKGAVMVTKPVRLHKAAMDHKDPYFKEAIDTVGWNFDDIQFAIPHQTSMRAIKKGAGKSFAFGGGEFKGQVVAIVGKYGNTSTTSHFLALHEKILNDTMDRNDNIFFLIQASGLTLGHACYTMDDLPARYRAHFAGKEELKYA